MSGVFRNIDPPTPSPPGVVGGGGEDTLAGWRGGRGSIVRKTPDTVLYSIYVSTLWLHRSQNGLKNHFYLLVQNLGVF
jgi:hypothetical protein